MYVTALELVTLFDAHEIAQAATPYPQRVPGVEVLLAVLNGEATGGFDPDEVATAQEVVAVIEGAISDANEEADGYLSRRFPGKLPLDPVPGMLRRLVANIARYNLHDQAPTDEIRNRRKDSVATLDKIAEGKVNLGVDDPAPSGTRVIKTSKTADDRTFSASKLADY